MKLIEKLFQRVRKRFGELEKEYDDLLEDGIQRSAEAILEELFERLIRDRDRKPKPDLVNAVELSADIAEGKTVKGWARKNDEEKGTLFVVHSLTRNSMSREIVAVASKLYNDHGLSVVVPDLRFHGLSHNTPLSFGAAEMNDIKAAADWAEEKGYGKPWILYGESLGAMASSCTVQRDDRFKAAVLKSCPSSPWEAIKVDFEQLHMDRITRIAELINKAYGDDPILEKGDVKNYTSTPDHKPYLYYLMGTEDMYGIDKTKDVFRFWYEGKYGDLTSEPGEGEGNRKWFTKFPGSDHYFHAHNTKGFFERVEKFIDFVLKN